MYKAASSSMQKKPKSPVRLSLKKDSAKGKIKGKNSLAHRLDVEAALANGQKLALKTNADLSANRFRGVKIYLVKFTLKSDPKVTFLKVGITRNSLQKRFEHDMESYDLETIVTSDYIGREKALVFEQNIHFAARAVKYYPRVPLESGNTECFKFNETNKALLGQLVKNCKE